MDVDPDFANIPDFESLKFRGRRVDLFCSVYRRFTPGRQAGTATIQDMAGSGW